MASPLPEKVSLFKAEKIKVVFSDLKTVETSCSQRAEKHDVHLKMVELDLSAETKVIRHPWNTSGMACSTCGVSFDSFESQREHFKMDWHHFNLKQKLMGKPSVLLEVFEDILSGDVSSISGSESDSDHDMDPNSDKLEFASVLDDSIDKHSTEEKERVNPKLYLSNQSDQIITLYRAVVHSSKITPPTEEELVHAVMELTNITQWGIFMSAGGHFAGAIFQGDAVVAHKTFHRYTVRAKRGTAQGLRDGQQGGNQPKSAGSSLRRYNEAALLQEVQDTLEGWTDHLWSCGRIFIRAPSYNKIFFFGGKKPAFSKDDPRIRTIPFATRRPTLKEVKRVHALLTTVEVFDRRSLSLEDLFKSNKKKKQEVKIPKDAQHETEQNKMMPEEQLKTDCVNSKNDCLDNELSDVDIEPESDSNAEQNIGKETVKSTKKISRRRQVLPPIWYEMYTCCKTGDVEKLKGLLRFYQQSETKEITTIEAGACNKDELLRNESQILEDLDSKSTEWEEIKKSNIEDRNVDINTAGAETVVSCASNEEGSFFNDHVICDKRTSDQPSDTHSETGEFIENHLKGDISNVNATDSTHKLSLETISVEEEQTVLSTDSRPVEKTENHVGNTENQVDTRSLPELVNLVYEERGERLLHVACRSHKLLVSLLLSAGADPALKDKSGRLPYSLAGNKEIRNEFRRFMAANPQRYDYIKAKIPSPLTEDMEKIEIKKKPRRKGHRKNQKLKQKALKETEKEKEKQEREKSVRKPE